MKYSEDLRKKVVSFLEKGHSQREAAAVFSLHLSTVNKWHQLYRQTGSVKDKPLCRSFKKLDLEKLKAYVSERPDAY